MAVHRVKRNIKHKKLDIQQALISMEGRLDAKMDMLETKIGDTAQSFKGHVDIRISHVQTQMEQRFEQVDKRFEQVDKRFEQVDKRFEQVDRRFEQVDRRFEQIDGRFEQVDGRFEQMNRRFDKLETKLDTNTAGLVDLIERRIGEIIKLDERVVYDS